MTTPLIFSPEWLLWAGFFMGVGVVIGKWNFIVDWIGSKFPDPHGVQGKKKV